MSCFGGLEEWCECFSFLRPPIDVGQEQEEFSTLIAFLAAVPLFKDQLPPAILPDIAVKLKRRRWQPGKAIVREGKSANEFFIVESGKAFVFCNRSGLSGPCSELTAGDYFGVRNLTGQSGQSTWQVTVVGAGPGELVTLSMTRKEFTRLGLQNKLKAPKRLALFGFASGPKGAAEGLGPPAPATTEDRALLTKVLKNNANIRHLLDSNCRVDSLVNSAKRKTVEKDAEVFRSSQVAPEIIVVLEGSFDVIHSDKVESNQKSAEAAAVRSRSRSGQAAVANRKMPVVRSAPANLSVDDEDDDDDVGCPQVKRMQSAMVMSTPGAIQGRKEVFKRPRRNSGVSCKIDQTKKSSGLRVGDSVEWSGSSGQKQEKQGAVPAPGARRKSFRNAFKREPLQPIAEAPRDEEDEVGTVIDISDSRVVVWFSSVGQKIVMPGDVVRRSGGDGHNRQLKRGDCFGEVSAVYNANLGASLKAREKSLVLSIPRRCITVAIRGENPDVDQFEMLLKEVDLLKPLLSAEVREIARNALGRRAFGPNEVILKEGSVRNDTAWYVVERGQCKVSTEAKGVVSTLNRGGHFGEYTVLRGEHEQQVTVTAGVTGVDCLALDIQALKFADSRELQREFSKSENARAATERNPWATTSANWYGKQDEDETEQQKHLGQEIPFERLRAKKLLGEGGFGRVTLVEDALFEPGESVYALKRMSKELIEQEDMTRRVVAEKEMMCLNVSPFVITFFRSFRDDRFVYFLMEPVLGGHLLEAKNDMPEVFCRDSPRGSATCFYAACIATALGHLHEHHILYRDMKCENVLIDAKGYAKVCDLGFARFCLNKCNTFLGTPAYMAPELIDEPHKHDFMVDWWALGIIVFELLTGKTPFDDEGVDEDDPWNLVKAIRRSQGQPLNELAVPRDINQTARSFFRELLEVTPGRRLGHRGAEQVKMHPWFKSLKFDFNALLDKRLKPPFCPEISNEDDGSLEEADARHDADGSLCRAPDPPNLLKSATGTLCTWDMHF
jgi:serine/threonine protein kinase/CRP-like cAMP-binding protein